MPMSVRVTMPDQQIDLTIARVVSDVTHEIANTYRVEEITQAGRRVAYYTTDYGTDPTLHVALALTALAGRPLPRQKRRCGALLVDARGDGYTCRKIVRQAGARCYLHRQWADPEGVAS